MTQGAREISVRVRDALLLLEQQEAGQPETLIGELEKEAGFSLRAIQNLIDGMARQRRLWLANDMNTAIADMDTPIEGTYSRKRWEEIKEVFDQFEQWLSTPLPSGVVPIVVVSRRGNPVELPPPPPAE